MRSRAIGKRRPYVRPMAGWWRRNPFFVEYMIHEGTAFFVAAYALVLLVELFALAQGEVAWNGWLSALKSPAAIACHLVIFVAMCYHSWTWFKIMPRTLPPIMIGGKRVSAMAITASGLLATAFASLVLAAAVWRLTT